MKHVLVLGAGKSSPSLIGYLLEHAAEHDWFITVGDLDVAAAEERIAGHSRGSAIPFNVNDPEMLERHVSKSDLVVNFLAPRFQATVARECVQQHVHMVSASYRSKEIRELHETAVRQGVLILNEMGLDPGMDLMSAMVIIDRVKKEGGSVRKFASYGSGLPAPDSLSNPFKYVITWNPYNVVMAGQSGAQFLEDGKIKILPYHKVFSQTWPVQVQNVGLFEAYPNRDSLAYRDQFGLDETETMIRGTLRYPTFSETWSAVIDLGLTNNDVTIPETDGLRLRDVVEMCLPQGGENGDLASRVANYLGISPTGHTMEKLEWLGLFSDTLVQGMKGGALADAMVQLLQEKLQLMPGHRDMVVLLHKLLVAYPGSDRPEEKITSTFVAYGDPDGDTAMAKTVGLPAGIATKLILTGELPLTGAHIPLHPAVYEPVLRELSEMGLQFVEEVHPTDEETENGNGTRRLGKI